MQCFTLLSLKIKMSDNVEFSTALFMEEVQTYECLYNKFNKQYKNKFVRLNCWRKIAEKFGIEPAEAEKKYKNVRTAYGRYLKKKKSLPSGSGRDAVQLPPAEFANLEWLEAHISQRGDTITNMPSVFLEESNDENEPEPQEEESASEKNIEIGLNDGNADDKQLDDGVNGKKDQFKDTRIVGLDAKETVDNFQVESAMKSAGKCIKKSATPKLKKPYAAHNEKNVKLDVDAMLLKTATSLAEKVLQSPEAEIKLHNNLDDDEDILFCRSVAKRMKRLQPHTRGFLKLQIEQMMYKAQFSNVPTVPTHVNMPNASQTLLNFPGMSYQQSSSDYAGSDYSY